MPDATCRDCGETYPAEDDGAPREPCPTCGGTRRVFDGSAVVAGGGAVRVEAAVVPSNAPAAKANALAAAVDRLATRHAANDSPQAVQQAVADALEILHTLDESLRAGDWAQTGWTPNQIETWVGLIAARNVVHHQRVAVVTIDLQGEPPEDRLRWEIDRAALAKLRRLQQQRPPYEKRCAGEPVIAQLRVAATLTSAAIV